MKTFSPFAMLALAAIPRLAAQAGWNNATPLPVPMGEIEGSTVGNKFYVMAGLNPATGRPIGAVFVFDTSTNAWTTRKPMPVASHHIMTTVLNGKIYVFGGFTSPKEFAAWQPINNSWEYDPATNEWRARAPMPTARNHFLAAAVNGKIYAIAGRLGVVNVTRADATDIVEEYDPAKDRWVDKGRAMIRRSGMAGGEYKGKIYLAGGEYQDREGPKAFWAVESFDPVANSWQLLPRMKVAHHGFAAGFVGSAFHVVGGGFQSDGMPGIDSKSAVHEVLDLGR